MTENSNNNPFIIPPEDIEEEPRRGTVLDRFNFTRSWLVVVIVLIIAALATLASIWFLRGIQNPQPNVALWFDTPGTIISGSASELVLVYENRDSKVLSNVSVEIVYPDNFRFLHSETQSVDGIGRQFNLGDITAHSSGTIKITGIFNGSLQEVQLVRAKMYFQQADSSAIFAVLADAKLSLEAPDFNLRINAPAQLVTNQRIQYNISFQNISDNNWDRVQIRLIYPSGFKFDRASLPSTDFSTWNMGSMEVGAQAFLDVSGTLTGSPGENKTLQADIGYLDAKGEFALQARAFASTKILASPLIVRISLADNKSNINEGESVRYNISYENSGEIGMNNVKIVVRLDENIVDYSTLLLSNGALVGKEIIWNPAGVPNLLVLQPQARGSLTFSLPTKKNLSALGIQNPKIRNTIAISSNELPEPVYGNETTIKVKTKLILSPSYEYVSGPLPPVPGQTTVYRVKLKIDNTVNEVKNLNFTSVVNIPTVDVVDKSWGQSANIRYNSASGRLSWNVEQLAAYDTAEVEFLVNVHPSEADRIGGLLLVKDMQIEGQDGFTNDMIASAASQELKLGY